VHGVAQGAERMEQLFALEKRIALDLFDQLDVRLTVAERNAIEQRPTRSLAAFLAYSRGLSAEDEGRYDDASRFYRDAARIDPDFGAALQKDRDARAMVTGARLSTQAIEGGFDGTAEAAAVTGSHGRGRHVPRPTTSIRRRQAPQRHRGGAASTDHRRRIPPPPQRTPTSRERDSVA
jgi:tetratricopeptide (TPR) repeat protein